VSISVDPQSCHNLGRRASLCETLLGLVISTFADETRIMIAGFIPNGEAIKHRNIKVGMFQIHCFNTEQNVYF
jgi:hypothetical protein